MRHPILATAAALAALAAGAGTASAHTATAAADCETWTIDGADFTEGLGGSITATATVDGANPQTATLVLRTFETGGSLVVRWPEPLQGDHIVRVTAAITAPDYQRGTFTAPPGAIPVSCPTTPPVTEPDVPTAPAPPTPPATTTGAPVEPQPRIRPATDCATLLKVGAGQKWLTRFGCTRPAPACSVLLYNGAGPRWYVRYGYDYRCAPPRPRVTIPPVAG